MYYLYQTKAKSQDHIKETLGVLFLEPTRKPNRTHKDAPIVDSMKVRSFESGDRSGSNNHRGVRLDF